MSRSSPSVRRVVVVLNFFAQHPGRAFTFTDILRALKLHRATCHALLNGLVEAGYLYRTRDKSYLMGPALVAIGRTANEHWSPLQVAQPEMRALADEFNVICSAFFLTGNDIIVRAQATAVSQFGYSIPQGTKLPLKPPFGAIFHVWSDEKEVDRWLSKINPEPTSEQRKATLKGIEFAREHGFVSGIRQSRPLQVDNLEKAFAENANIPVTPLYEIKANQNYPLTYLNAPVFNEKNEVEFVIGLMGFVQPMKGSEILEAGRTLREACERVTDFVAGKR